MRDLPGNEHKSGLLPHISPLGAWALSLGTSIGWGSLIVTSTTYLSDAGPMGSTFGMILGALIMLVISRNYHYMMNVYPDSGGVYAFSKEMFGYDHGFLTAWFVALTYMAVFWANATSLPLFARYFLGSVFRFGYMYSLFGYDVYLGEVLLTIAAIALFVVVLMRDTKISMAVLTGTVILFTVGITVCFLFALAKMGGTGHTLEPSYIPGEEALPQIVGIAVISPWAFIGFENISHVTEEFSFARKKCFGILTLSVIATTLLYIFVTLLSASAYPPEYGNWLAYIRDLPNLDGIKGLPAFYAANYYLGRPGLWLLVLSLLCLIISSLIGNLLALSRLLYAVARDDVLPERFAVLNDRHIPYRTVLLVGLVSLPIPFLGRTAIGWIVDVTTIGATITYGFISACAMKRAREEGDRKEAVFGFIGLLIMLVFGISLLLPNLFHAGTMATESYFLFTVWAFFGFIFLRSILKRDHRKRFGKSIIVWIALLGLVLFTALIWMSEATISKSSQALENMREHYAQEESGEDSGEIESAEAGEVFIAHEMEEIRTSNGQSMLVVVILFAMSLGVLMSNYSIMSRRAQESEQELSNVRNMANRDPLTGVKSKYAYSQRIQEIDGLISAGELKEFAVVVCDVNGLKYVNDTFGHKAGDEYICSASRMICELYDHSPVFRIGGDEFVVLLTGRDYSAREEIFADLLARSEAHIKSAEVVVAAGMSDFESGKDADFHAVFGRADARMYEVKQALKAKGARTR